jgi:hypothetical protein
MAPTLYATIFGFKQGSRVVYQAIETLHALLVTEVP